MELLNTHKDTPASMLSETLLPANECSSVVVGLCTSEKIVVFGATTNDPND
jgi:hypothetical protein